MPKKIEITVKDATWILNRLFEFSEWPGTSLSQSDKLWGMACKLRGKVEKCKKGSKK